MVYELAAAELFPYLLIFLRIGAGLMLLPPFGEGSVPGRSRLHLAIALSVIVAPLVEQYVPAMPPDFAEAALLVIREVAIGLAIGAVTRLVLSALHVAGMVMAFQSSLAAALFFDPNQGQQTGVIANFLNLLVILLIFATDMHHLLLRALIESFMVFRPEAMPPIEDFANLAAQVVSDAFALGVQLAAPLLIVGFLLYLVAGVINRLVPQIQVFFVVLPLQVLTAFVVLMLTLSAVMMWFMRHFDDAVGAFLLPG